MMNLYLSAAEYDYHTLLKVADWIRVVSQMVLLFIQHKLPHPFLQVWQL